MNEAGAFEINVQCAWVINTGNEKPSNHQNGRRPTSLTTAADEQRAFDAVMDLLGNHARQ
jgi:hypothetical protein